MRQSNFKFSCQKNFVNLGAKNKKMGKRERKFKFAKIPRYLPGQVSQNILETDLAQYNIHRYRVFAAKSLVDHYPGRMNPFNYLNVRKMRADAIRLRKIDLENKELLKKINTINRLGGRVDCYNPLAYERINKWPSYNFHIRSVEFKNREMYKLIKSAKSFYDNEMLKMQWEVTLAKIKHVCLYPLTIVNKSSLDNDLKQSQSISFLLPNEISGLRPLAFLDFSIKDGKYLGRMIIELYYDHVPVTVQNFLELCKGKDLTYKNNLVHRIIRGQYMEMGDITQNTGRGGFSIYGKSFPEESHKLKHTKAGVISMKRIGWAENNSQFCITFQKMEQLDYKNVVFGKVIKGNNVLMDIQYYGRKIGKPLENIIISNCGEYVSKFRAALDI